MCSQAVAVERDAVGGGARVHRVDLPREQAVVDASESGCGTNRAKENRATSEFVLKEKNKTKY